jgi:hypothetical protein
VNIHPFWANFRWLLMQSFSIVQLPIVRLIVALLLAGVMVSILWQKPFERGRWKRSYWLVFTQSVLTVAVVAVGVVFRASTNPPAWPKVNPVGGRLLNILFFASLALGSLLVYRMKGVRWLGFCLIVLQQLFLLSAGFMASMSVSGDWL